MVTAIVILSAALVIALLFLVAALNDLFEARNMRDAQTAAVDRQLGVARDLRTERDEHRDRANNLEKLILRMQMQAKEKAKKSRKRK